VIKNGAEHNQPRLMLRGCTALQSNVRPTEAEPDNFGKSAQCTLFPFTHIEILLQIKDMSCLYELMTGPATANSLSTAKLLDELTLCL
jgi:hypothetical protein